MERTAKIQVSSHRANEIAFKVDRPCTVRISNNSSNGKPGALSSGSILIRVDGGRIGEMATDNAAQVFATLQNAQLSTPFTNTQPKHMDILSGEETDASDSDTQVFISMRKRQHRKMLTRRRVSTPKPRSSNRTHACRMPTPRRRSVSCTNLRLQRSTSDDSNRVSSRAGHVVQGTCVGGRQSRSPKCYQPLINDKMHMHQLGDITRRSSYGNGLEGLRPIRHHSAGCCASAESGSLSETDSLSSRYVSAASTQNDSLSSYMDGLAAPFVLPLRETLIYQCFLLSLGAVPIMYTRSAASIVNKAIVSLKNQAIVARTVFMQIYYKMIVVYNKRREITHRLLATNIDVAVASAENRQLLGVIVSSPRRDRFVCHVFGTDEQLLFHFAHGKYTRRYGVNCTRVQDGSMVFCNEFPHSAVSVVRHINYMQDSPRIEAPQRCITSKHTRFAKRNQHYTRPILSSLSDNVIESSSSQTATSDSLSFAAQRRDASADLKSNANQSSSELCGRIGVLPMKLIESPLIRQKAVTDLIEFSRRCSGYSRNVTESGANENSAHFNEKHLLFGFRSAHDQSEHVGFGTRSSAIGGDRNAGDWLTWPSKTTHSASSKRAISTDGRGECASVWVKPRGGEVRAKVAVEERISAQPRTQSPPTSLSARTLTTNAQTCTHRSDLSNGSSRYQHQSRNERNDKRKDCELETKEHVEAHTACGNLSDGCTAAPSAHTRNPTVTVQERVGEAECARMANGEHAHASGLCSDRGTSDVERILHNPIYRRPFQQFLEQQFCAENINFYVAVEEYRAIPDSEMERRSQVARQIYERHFAANSIEPVNIDNSTSKSIRDAVLAQRFSAQLYDVAQYQIFHLLKYDCWPRYLRAGGVAPSFDDASGEEHPGPSTQPTQPSQQHQSGDKKRKSLLWHGLKPRFSRRKKESRSGDILTGTHSYGSSGSPQAAETRSCGGVETGKHSPLQRLASSDTPTATVSPTMSPPDTDGSRLVRRAIASSPCSPQPCGSFDSVVDEDLADVFARPASASRRVRISWSGSKRRQGFTNSGKQFSMPAEFLYGQQRSGGGATVAQSSSSASPNRSRQSAAEVCTRFCTLMHNEIASSEQIPLNDPTESVGKWTSVMAAKRGMDPRATEAVDAQSLSTIDPARQAMDALNNRCVCLMPVLHFALEILAPNASTKTGSPSNSRIVLLRARHGLSSGVVLRSVLAKFSVEYDTCVVVLSGTLETIASHINVGTIGSRCVTVMTQQQFQERQHSPKRETMKDAPVSAHFLSPDASFPFYQHGDVAFFELPPDFDPRTGKINAARSFSNAKTDHTSGLLKFVRKASQAVTSREHETVASSSSTHHAHHHSGHNQHSSSMTSAYADKIRRKSVGTFQRTSSAAAASDIPYCGENNVPDEQSTKEAEKRPEVSGSSPEPIGGSGSGVQTPADGRGRVYELPDFLRKENCLDSSVETGMSKLRYCAESVTASGANGSASRIPPIYASAVPSEKDLTPCEVEKAIVWQRADYV